MHYSRMQALLGQVVYHGMSANKSDFVLEVMFHINGVRL